MTDIGCFRLAAEPAQYARLDNGIDIHFKLVGDSGPVTVLVHGGGCDLTFWDLQIPALIEHSRVLALDLPGHGQSTTRPDIRYSMNLYARAINRVLDHANIAQAIMVGHSLGVPALRAFYRHWPQKMRGLIAIDGMLVFNNISFAYTLLKWLVSGPMYGVTWPLLVHSYTGKATPQWGRDKVNNAMRSAPKYLIQSFFTEMLHQESAIDDPIDVPILAICADSPVWTTAVQSQIRNLNNRVDLVVLPDVSHFLMLDQPKTTNDLLVNFVKRYS